MRRMATTKQLEFVDKTSEVIKVNNLEEVIKIPFPYVNLEAEEENLEERVEAEEINFETHTINGSSGITYYASEDLDKDKGYVVIVTDENISFPETISTVSALAKWLSENLPLDEHAYMDDSKLPSLPDTKWYDFGDQEFEFSNNILYVIGYISFSQEDTPILEIGTKRIPKIYAIDFDGSIGTNNPQPGNFSTAKINWMYLKELYAYPNTGGIVNVYDNLKITNNKYLQAPYLYGQLGSKNTKSNAYVNNLYLYGNFVTSSDEGAILLEGGNANFYLNEEGDNRVKISTDGNVEIKGAGISLNAVTELSLNAESAISLLGDSNKKIEITNQGVFLSDLPTSDPQKANQLWNDNGVLKISSGN